MYEALIEQLRDVIAAKTSRGEQLWKSAEPSDDTAARLALVTSIREEVEILEAAIEVLKRGE